MDPMILWGKFIYKCVNILLTIKFSGLSPDEESIQANNGTPACEVCLLREYSSI